MALKEGSKELIWLKAVFNQLEPLKPYIPDILYSDNMGAIQLSRNPEYYAKTKHIDIQYHFVRDYIKKGLFKLEWIPTGD